MRGSDENGEIDNAAVIAYLDACVDPASRGDMDDLLHSPTIRVTLTTLVDVYKALTVAYTGRPTSRRSESRERSLPTKATSTGAASSRASTRRASR